MSIISYTWNIKELCDSFSLISVNVEDDEILQICLRAIALWFGAMRTVVLARENPRSFFHLQSMFLVIENLVQTKSNTS